MWFSKNDDGYRAWITLSDKNGALRTGGVPADFVATVVNPTGVTTTVLAVSESAGKPGLYTFLIPSSFFATHGLGGYGVVVEVDITTAPKVRAVLGEILRVFEEDFDSIADLGRMLSYEGVIHINTKTGTAGTVVGVNGTPGNPVDTLADAVTLAAATGLQKYHLVGNITLASTHDDWVFEGGAAEAAINLGGQDVADSLFRNIQLSGTIGNGPVQADNCDLDGVGNFTGSASDCGLVNGTELGAGVSTFSHCYSAVPGLGTPSLDLDGVASLNMRAYSGGIELRNMTNAGQNVTLEFIAGQAVLPASLTAGTLTLRGIGNLTDNSAGTTIEKNAFLNIDAIWDEVQDGSITAREIMKRINAMARGKIALSGAAAKPAQNAVYYDEAGAPLFTNINTGDERNPL